MKKEKGCSLLMLLSPEEVEEMGLSYMGVNTYNKSKAFKLDEFHSHYGSDALDLAEIWYDLSNTSIDEALIPTREQNMVGFRMFMAANHFLWAYPKNAKMLASRFGICERYARGENLWKWIRRIAAMKEKKIVWDKTLDNPETETFCVSLDGTDFKVWEKQHPTFPIDREQYSQKFNHGALKYEIALSVQRSKCVHISGPFRGGLGDVDMFRKGGLKEKLSANKYAIADRGYRSKFDDDRKVLSLPNPKYDSKELNNFKSRARLRHETFNGRLKFFSSLSQTYHHRLNNHKHVFEAVVVIVQYQMDNGKELFSV